MANGMAGQEGLMEALSPVKGFARAVGTGLAPSAPIAVKWTVTATRYDQRIIGVSIYTELRLRDRFVAATTYEVHEVLAIRLGEELAASLEWKLQEEG
jgi:hypothetical protein